MGFFLLTFYQAVSNQNKVDTQFGPILHDDLVTTLTTNCFFLFLPVLPYIVEVFLVKDYLRLSP